MYIHKGRHLSQIYSFSNSLIEIQFTYLKCVVQCFLVYYSYATITILEHSLHPPKKILCPLAVTPFFLQPYVTISPLSLYILIDLPILDIAYEWNYTICGLL